jgi:hypothetical protein
MALTTDDRITIYELIALHGHLMDGGEFERLDELFTEDFVYDVTALGFETLEGIDALTEASRACGDDKRGRARRGLASWPTERAARWFTTISFVGQAPGGGSRTAP